MKGFKIFLVPTKGKYTIAFVFGLGEIEGESSGVV
jgi:hypothetical protein